MKQQLLDFRQLLDCPTQNYHTEQKTILTGAFVQINQEKKNNWKMNFSEDPICILKRKKNLGGGMENVKRA